MLQSVAILEHLLRTELSIEGPVALHEPCFGADELSLVEECVRSGWVSSAGAFVEQFEDAVATRAGCKHGIAMMNGTAALHLALHVLGVRPGDLVLCPSLTFVATANAISHCGATPLLCDCEEDALGIDPERLRHFLENHCRRTSDGPMFDGRRITACIVVHVFGHPCRIRELTDLCAEHEIPLVEDATEALGSRSEDRPLGSFGAIGVFSFNGNKIITTGGGGMAVTSDGDLARRLKHLSTTAKQPHPWEFIHDEVAWNYRLPNINAALGCAQIRHLDDFICRKRRLAELYAEAFASDPAVTFITEPANAHSNYWLHGLRLASPAMRDDFLHQTHDLRIFTRPVWQPMHLLPPYRKAPRCHELQTAEAMAAVTVNLPSSASLLPK